jgi:hypothetical protein
VRLQAIASSRLARYAPQSFPATTAAAETQCGRHAIFEEVLCDELEVRAETVARAILTDGKPALPKLPPVMTSP